MEQQSKVASDPAVRIYRALGRTAIGIRAGIIPREHILELLIEVPNNWNETINLPEWRGMHFEVISLRLPPREENPQLRLYLDDIEHKDIFIIFCEDLVNTLEDITQPQIRMEMIEECITRWSRFFDKSGYRGLSSTMQRGLYAELAWLGILLDSGLDAVIAVISWKGCERGYHDFDIHGEIIEVKSTMTREPRHVRINNERQLDDRGLKSLHLFVLTLHKTDGGGVTLPALVGQIREQLSETSAAISRFERSLISAGYLDKHASNYASNYIVKRSEIFHVTDGFPRILELPQGVGHLKYSVTISACQNFSTEIQDYLKNLIDNYDG